MLPLRWSHQAEKIRFYLDKRSLFPRFCFWFSCSPQRVRPPARCACLAHFPLESSFKIKVSGREGTPIGVDPSTGKRSAVKVARCVWREGKAARPYLSLPLSSANLRAMKDALTPVRLLR